jgi:hypothetical protein
MMMIVLRLLSLLGLKSRWHRHFSPRPLNEMFFQGDKVGGFVDSRPETLVPSASNRSTPEWTLVDSRQRRFDEKQLRARQVPLSIFARNMYVPKRPGVGADDNTRRFAWI